MNHGGGDILHVLLVGGAAVGVDGEEVVEGLADFFVFGSGGVKVAEDESLEELELVRNMNAERLNEHSHLHPR